MNRENDVDAITINVTEEEYHRDLARGLHEDEAMKPGRHKFKRGGFLRRHGVDATPPKIRISVDVDQDIVDYFKKRASDADSYKHEFNEILRGLIEAEKHLLSSGEPK
jgi:uncharacterized protein (DUF4415 family)